MAGLGALILVVGPSGAGKDTLLDGAAEKLAPSGRFHFARRAITRPANAGGENHVEMDKAAFLAQEAEGKYLLSWRAHALCYGIPREPTETMRSEGIAVVANISRSVIEAARARLQPVSVILVKASPQILAERLALRGRETVEDIANRLARAGAITTSDSDLTTVRNDGDVASGIAAMTAALETASAAEWQPPE
jgi:phosphonate metabolism protein PhnN/1,5-bisphosphokinase (PRPP-forming)